MSDLPPEELVKALRAAYEHQASDGDLDYPLWSVGGLTPRDLSQAAALIERLEARVAELEGENGEGAGFFEKVAETVKEADLDRAGFWRTCSGCHESEDGHDIGHYPHSPSFNCKLGGGCNECGGIGAIWDTIDYDAMAREMLADSALGDDMPARKASKYLAQGEG